LTQGEGSSPGSAPPATSDPLLLSHPASMRHVAAGGHPERPERLTAIEEALNADAHLASLPRARPDGADLALLEAVHQPGYVAAIMRLGNEVDRRQEGGWIDADTWIGPGSLEAALTSAGAAAEGVRRVLAGHQARAFSLCRPPGHHATRNTAMGFCLFNNIAVAAQVAVEAGIERVAIVDFDVHHGNGTQDIFYARSDVLYMSCHQWPLYPGTGAAGERGRGEGEGFTLNVPMPAGGGDAEYLEVFDKRFAPALKDHRPDLILVSAGFDAHEGDPLANMLLTTEGYARLAARIRTWSQALCGDRSVWCLEGGYDLDALAASVARVVTELHKAG
jgi:acetoin utilization deacetylase AcuC-like enzyme